MIENQEDVHEAKTNETRPDRHTRFRFSWCCPCGIAAGIPRYRRELSTKRAPVCPEALRVCDFLARQRPFVRSPSTDKGTRRLPRRRICAAHN
jgi:hypothetical protein